MKRMVAIGLLVACAGCLSASNPTMCEWPVRAGVMTARVNEAKFGVSRLSQVAVRAPYDVRALAVLKADASLAFDPYNRFAAQPAQLLKGPVQELLAASGLFTAVLSASSAANASHLIEVTLTNLRLNCATEQQGARTAEVAVSVVILDARREIVATVCGSGAADAADGDYGEAFSRALAVALSAAMRGL